MSLANRLARLEEKGKKSMAPTYLLEEIRRRREEKADYRPVPPDLDFNAAFSMLIEVLPD